MGVCSSKNYPYRGQSEKCPGKTAISSLCEQLEKLAHITYFCLVRERNVVKKKQEATGEEMAAMLEDLVIGTKMRYASCIYNIYIPLILWVQAPKNFLKENEVILSVDISKNYQNKQCHKIQNAFFGHENFTLFTAASYFHTDSCQYWELLQQYWDSRQYWELLVCSLFQLQWCLMKLLTVIMWHSQITTNWSSLYKKLIQLSIHFIFGPMDVPDNLGPHMYSVHFSTTQ